MKSLRIRISRLVASSVIFVAVLVVWLVFRFLLPYHLQYILGFLLILPALWAGLELTRLVAQLDELQQRLALEALAFGLANTVLVCFALGMLQPSFQWAINMAWVLPIGALFCGFGYLLARRRYHEE